VELVEAVEAALLVLLTVVPAIDSSVLAFVENKQLELAQMLAVNIIHNMDDAKQLEVLLDLEIMDIRNSIFVKAVVSFDLYKYYNLFVVQ